MPRRNSLSGGKMVRGVVMRFAKEFLRVHSSAEAM
jgi:hypothetical protein